MEEIFKPIEGFPGYFISNEGRVLSKKRETPIFMSPQKSRLGFKTILLWRDHTIVTLYIARLVLEAFEGYPAEPWLCVAHNINGDLDDCRLRNLEWVVCETTDEYDPAVSHRKGVLKPDFTKERMTEAKKNQKKDTIEKATINRLKTLKLRYNYNISKLLDE